ncbi:hypothetical protein KKB58_02700 [Patescibacteria group bacterium]|nr:hypothetical protein [Patescibacteria group bacterium]
MENETKQCQNCKHDFVIEPEDFNFYEKIKVPLPTFCPNCRLQRRLAWMPSFTLFKRKCDLCGEEGLSMYEPNAPFTVYCVKCWWSDNWDPLSFGIEIDFNKPFLEQWKELLCKTPVLALHVDSATIKTSPYVNHVAHSRNCYMVYFSDYNEDCVSDFWLTRNKDLYICSVVMDSEKCFDCSNLFKSYNIYGSISNNRFCYDSAFIRDCEGAHHCFGVANIKNGSYVFMGEKFSEEEYKKKINNIDLGSYKEYIYWKEKAQEYFKNTLPQPVWETQSNNVSGSYVFRSKNCKQCFDVTSCEDSKYLMLIRDGSTKDSYDYVDWGMNAELIYECVTVGESPFNVKFSHESGWGLNDAEYCKSVVGGSDYFGCISIRNKKYCILNKQYSKEEYFKLREKIIKHMEDMPYVDKKGNVYRYGEFFPMEFSPHAYNNSYANFLFSKTKNEVEDYKLRWHDHFFEKYPITINYTDLPDNIKDTSNEILKEVIQCSTCPRGYKIVSQEIDLVKKLNVPLSRQCPFCRIEEKVKTWVSQMKEIDRVCDKCGIYFKTHYTEDEAPKIFCKDCYKKEVY